MRVVVLLVPDTENIQKNAFNKKELYQIEKKSFI